MSDAETTDAPRFRIPLPGGRVARVPLEVLEKYVDPQAMAFHSTPAPKPASDPKEHHIHVHVHVHTDPSGTEEEDDDVVAHSLSVDASTGTSEFHTDWEQGECDYTDESGFPQRIIAWHRHPFGTEYSEIFEG